MRTQVQANIAHAPASSKCPTKTRAGRVYHDLVRGPDSRRACLKSDYKRLIKLL